MICNLIWSGALWILTVSPGASRVGFLARIARFDTRTGRLLEEQFEAKREKESVQDGLLFKQPTLSGIDCDLSRSITWNE